MWEDQRLVLVPVLHPGSNELRPWPCPFHDIYVTPTQGHLRVVYVSRSCRDVWNLTCLLMSWWFIGLEIDKYDVSVIIGCHGNLAIKLQYKTKNELNRDVRKAGLLYTLCQCTPLLVEKGGVATDVTVRFTVCKQVCVQVREPPWL